MVKSADLKTSDSVFAKIVSRVVKDQIDSLRKNLSQDLKASFEFFKFDILNAFDKKNDDLRSDVATMKDEIVGEIKGMREEYNILKGRHGQILDHENRIEKLEKIHSQGHHATI